jgi:peptidoglycan/xylan/chitin deacetylase (PgdA/CDA1 family)
MKSGVFVISIDLELAWKACDRPLTDRYMQTVGRERDIVKAILDLFSAYRISATWALVGHLLLSECEWSGGLVHPEIPRPVIKNENRDWFYQHPPAGDHDSLWHAFDIVDTLKKVQPKQELGSHSFCHLPYSESRTNRQAVQADIERAKGLHEAHGIPYHAFVFPRNQVGFKDLLARSGIRVYRGLTHRWYYSIPSDYLIRLFNLSRFYLGLTPRTVRPYRDTYGMINVPDSVLFIGRDGLRRFISPRKLTRTLISGLDRAVRRREIFHLWFHPSNFAFRSEEQIGILESVLKYADQLRGQGVLDILTMGETADRFLEGETPTPCTGS